MIGFIHKWAKKKSPGAATWKTVLWFVAWRSWLPWVWYGLYKQRIFNTENIPEDGPLLLICNHQSYFDLVSIGVTAHKRIFISMARSTLFKNPFFGKLIDSLNAYPIVQGGSDRKALMGIVDLLKNGNCVLVFPEGSRTYDGKIGKFQPGIMLLIKRAKPTIVPMALEGPYNVWSINDKLPKIFGHRVALEVGEPIAAEDLLKMNNADALAHLQSTIETMRLNLRTRLRANTCGRYPPASPADEPGCPIFKDQLITIDDLPNVIKPS